MIALMNFSFKNGVIAIGLHKVPNYPDCDEYFVRKIQSIFDIYAEGTIQIGAPFLNFNKSQIWKFCQDGNVPLHLT